MSTCAVIGWSVVVLAVCIAGVVAIGRMAAKALEEDDWEPY